jgi:voltage-gated potassium channel Kch
VQANFPHLRIVARARNRQHAYALLGAGVENVIRETFAASIEASRLTLEELGFAPADAKRTVTTFAAYDERTMRTSAPLRDDEKALIESAKKYASELERIFEEDERSRS